MSYMSVSNSFIRRLCVLLYMYKIHRTAHIRTAQARSQHVAPRGTIRSSRQRLMQLLQLPIPTPLKLSLLARAPDCPHPRCCCCCCCRPAAVGTLYERRRIAEWFSECYSALIIRQDYSAQGNLCSAVHHCLAWFRVVRSRDFIVPDIMMLKAHVIQ